MPGSSDQPTAHGSSPLARGTPWPGMRKLGEKRFIPAGAGNTRGVPTTETRWPVHPRWRGEHGGSAAVVDWINGSSPLARGTQFRVHLANPGMRFIPAGAGNTNCPSASGFSETVHPRWRGEHCFSLGASEPTNGSSPLARGTLIDYIEDSHRTRFIPAGAGNTLPECSPKGVEAVHPRWRGEHASRGSSYQAASGSSPLARGTRLPPSKPPSCWRFIPAGAGNT